MNRHLRTHRTTNEKPFECEDCGKGFTEKIYLARHKKRLNGCAWHLKKESMDDSSDEMDEESEDGENAAGYSTLNNPDNCDPSV